jgi:hypothetical protein
LIIACRNLLTFYKAEAAKGSFMTDFFLKTENFAKLKKQFDAKAGPRQTQQDIDQYNKAVNEMNDAVKEYNANNDQFNKERSKGLDGWNNAVKDYLDNYVPTQHR